MLTDQGENEGSSVGDVDDNSSIIRKNEPNRIENRIENPIELVIDEKIRPHVNKFTYEFVNIINILQGLTKEARKKSQENAEKLKNSRDSGEEMEETKGDESQENTKGKTKTPRQLMSRIVKALSFGRRKTVKNPEGETETPRQLISDRIVNALSLGRRKTVKNPEGKTEGGQPDGLTLTGIINASLFRQISDLLVAKMNNMAYDENATIQPNPSNQPESGDYNSKNLVMFKNYAFLLFLVMNNDLINYPTIPDNDTESGIIAAINDTDSAKLTQLIQLIKGFDPSDVTIIMNMINEIQDMVEDLKPTIFKGIPILSKLQDTGGPPVFNVPSSNGSSIDLGVYIRDFATLQGTGNGADKNSPQPELDTFMNLVDMYTDHINNIPLKLIGDNYVKKFTTYQTTYGKKLLYTNITDIKNQIITIRDNIVTLIQLIQGGIQGSDFSSANTVSNAIDYIHNIEKTIREYIIIKTDYIYTYQHIKRIYDISTIIQYIITNYKILDFDSVIPIFLTFLNLSVIISRCIVGEDDICGSDMSYVKQVNDLLSDIEKNLLTDIKGLQEDGNYNPDLVNRIKNYQAELDRLITGVNTAHIGGKKSGVKFTYKNKRKTRKTRKSKPTRRTSSPHKKYYYY
jgi:hypothetical protein